MQLEGACINYQTQVDRLQKDVLRLKGRLEGRDKAILELNMEISQLNEDMAKM